MKKILSGLLILLGVFAFTLPSANAASIYYSIPLWGDNGSGATRTTISVVALGDLTKNVDFQSTGATVNISLYNNVITQSSLDSWASVSVTGTGSLWGTLNKSMGVGGSRSFLADTQNSGTSTSGKWATSSGWAANTSNWGFGIIEITTTGTVAPSTSDFTINGFFYNTSLAGFPITISSFN